MIVSVLNRIRTVGELVKFSHSLFALPFALASMLIAANGLPPWRTFLLIVLAMVTARNSAMAFNRYLDADLDAKNPRTATRPIPEGRVSRSFALAFSIVNALLFVIAAGLLNHLCFWLSFIALGIILSYSYTKRLTPWTHLFLGFSLGLAPIGAWIAVTGRFAPEPILLGIAVVLWVAGFDVIYATQDYEFDKREGLRSLVAHFGIAKALTIARLFHALVLLLLLVFGRILNLGWEYDLAWGLIAFLFLYQHALVRPTDLSRVNAAFFNVNGFISLLFLAGVTLSL